MSRSPDRGHAIGASLRTACTRSVRALIGPSPVNDVQLNVAELAKPQMTMWANSAERTWYLSRRPRTYRFASIGVGLLLLAAVLLQPGSRDAQHLWWGGVLLFLGAVILAYCTFPYWAARLAFADRRRKMAAIRADIALNDLLQDEKIPLNRLFVLNRRHLEAYQESSRRQQAVGFRFAEASGLAGFLVLVVGIVISLREGPGRETYVVAGLSGLGTLLSAYLGAVFLRLAKDANDQLNLYSLEPHITGRILAAERLADAGSNATADSERAAIISALLGWPFPGDSVPAQNDENNPENRG